MNETADARLRRMLEIHELLFDVASDIGPGYDLHGLLQQVLKAMRRLVDFRGGSIALIEGDVLRLVVTDPEVSPEVMAARLPVGQGLAGRAAAGAEPVSSPNLDRDPRVVPELRKLGSNAGIVSYVAVPLVCLGQVIGVLQVDSGEEHAFDADDVTLLQGLGVLVAGSIESARRNDAVAELETLRLDFLNRTAHELRTPLTILEGFADLARDRDASLDLDETFDRMGRAVGRLRHLVEQTLDVLGLEAGTRRPDPRLVDLDALVASALDAAPRDFPLRIDESVRRKLRTDPGVVEKVLRILLENAAKYADEAEIRVVPHGGGVSVVVDDRGPGVPERLRPHLFERFTRGDDHGAGLGLGLAIARRLASIIDGTVAYEPRADGSRFTLVLREAAPAVQPP